MINIVNARADAYMYGQTDSFFEVEGFGGFPRIFHVNLSIIDGLKNFFVTHSNCNLGRILA